MGGRSAKIRHPETIGLHVRVVLSRGVALGPGRVELLRLVGELGSIAAAGRAMDMSYKRAWTLLDATAKAFGAPVVVASPGGASGGQAALTDLGMRLVRLYQAIEEKAAAAAAAELAALQKLAAGES
jgi:molybdate transport system regulatory protein